MANTKGTESPADFIDVFNNESNPSKAELTELVDKLYKRINNLEFMLYDKDEDLLNARIDYHESKAMLHKEKCVYLKAELHRHINNEPN